MDIDPKNIIACQDCGTVGELQDLPASASYHVDRDDDYCKKVCKDKCQHICKCGTLNRIDIKANSVDNYYDGYKCETINKVNCRYLGNVKEMCDRYCGCGSFEQDIILDGSAFEI